MIFFILTRVIASICLICTLHYIWGYLIATFTVPKVHDVVQTTQRQYQQIASVLNSPNPQDMKDELTTFAKQYV